MTLSCPAFGIAPAKQVSLTQCVMRRQTLQADTLRPHVLGDANPRKFAGAFRLGHLQLASSQCPDQHALNHPWPDPMGPRKGLPTANSHLRQSARQRHQAPLGATALRLPATPPRRQLTALLRNAVVEVNGIEPMTSC